MASAASVGDLLRAERQRRGWTLADAEIYLKIRRSMLEAIEQGRFELLPGRAYAIAFARTYAEFLGLDAESVVERCRAELRNTAEPKASGSTTGMFGDIDLPRVGMAAAAVVGVILAGLWMFDGGSADDAGRRVEAQAPQVLPPREPAAAVNQMPTVPSGPGTAAAMPPPPPPTPAAAAATPAASPGSADPAAAQASARANAQTAQAPPGSRAVPGSSRISLKANGDTWIEIRDPAGASVLARVLRNGEVYNVPDRPGLVLSSGRITTIEVRVDGQMVPAQGRARREMSLDPSRLLQAAQVPAADPAAQSPPARPPRRGNPPQNPAAGAAPAAPGTPPATGN